MNLSFPYLPLITRLSDLPSYLIIRSMCSPRLQGFKPFRKLLSNSLKYVGVSPPAIKGNKVFLATDDPSQVSIFREIFLDHVYDLTRVPFTPQCVVDCGAHVGMFSLLASTQFPTATAVAIEPNPDNLRVLRHTVSTNRLNIEIVEAAVSTHDGVACFTSQSSFGGHVVHSDATSETPQIEVRLIELKAHIAKLNCESLLLKLDVEGAEEEVLPDIIGVLPEQSAIFIETHGGETAWQKASHLLENAGFNVSRTRTHDRYVDAYAVRLK